MSLKDILEITACRDILGYLGIYWDIFWGKLPDGSQCYSELDSAKLLLENSTTLPKMMQ